MRRSFWIASTLLLLMAGLLASCGGGGPSSSTTTDAGPSSSTTTDAGRSASATALAGPASSAAPVLQGTAAMAADAVSGGVLDATRLVADRNPFDVDIVILSVDAGYGAYQYKLEWDPSILAYDGEKHLMPAELNVCADAQVATNDIYTGCARAGGNATFTGPLETVTLHCIGTGTSQLHLKTIAEDPDFGTSVISDVAYYMNTALTDASVTCQG
jgi:hypothetical protein